MRQPLAGQCQLVPLLERFDHFGCADERDRIYAIAGLAEDVVSTSSSGGDTGGRDKRLGAKAISSASDYRLKAEKLYTQIAESLVNSGQLLRVLSQASIRRGRRSGLPSWVPDWSVPIRRRACWSQDGECLQDSQVDQFNTSTYALVTDFYYIQRWIPEPSAWRKDQSDNRKQLMKLPSANYVANDISPLEVVWTSSPYPSGADPKVIEKWTREVKVVVEAMVDCEARPADAKAKSREDANHFAVYGQILTLFAIAISGPHEGGITTASIRHDASQPSLFRDLARWLRSENGSVAAPAAGTGGEHEVPAEFMTTKDSANGPGEGAAPTLVDCDQLTQQNLDYAMNDRCLFAYRLRDAKVSDFCPGYQGNALRLGIGPSEAERGDKIVLFSTKGRAKHTQTYLFREAVVETAGFFERRRQVIPPRFTGFELVGDCYLFDSTLPTNMDTDETVSDEVGKMGIFLI